MTASGKENNKSCLLNGLFFNATGPQKANWPSNYFLLLTLPLPHFGVKEQRKTRKLVSYRNPGRLKTTRGPKHSYHQQDFHLLGWDKKEIWKNKQRIDLKKKEEGCHPQNYVHIFF